MGSVPARKNPVVMTKLSGRISSAVGGGSSSGSARTSSSDGGTFGLEGGVSGVSIPRG
jgi:hypothetical protein